MPEIQVSDHVDVEALRTRLRKMTDAELQRFGRNNRCAARTRPFVIPLREARAEWRRRYSKTTSSDSVCTRQNSDGRKCIDQSLPLLG